jgi:hypothetical protein
MKRTRAALEQELEDYRNRYRAEREAREAAERSLKQSREHFDDLKTRLHAAETANQFMRGYLSRVQEDDVVREELVTTGEPNGEQRLVPKRKPTEFERPQDFTEFRRRDEFGYMAERDRPKPKHWITY